MTFREFCSKVKPLLVFALFGGIATILDTCLYYLLYEVYGVPNTVSTVTSWLLVLFFCFVTNKVFVYHSTTWQMKDVWRELLGFASCRLGTGILNLVFMMVTVDMLVWPAVPMKLLSAFLLGFVNFAVGRILIFRRK